MDAENSGLNMWNGFAKIDRKRLKMHMGVTPQIGSHRAFDRRTGKTIKVKVVKNYTPAKDDIIIETCLACTINEPCTPFAKDQGNTCAKFNTPAIMRVIIPREDCEGCERKDRAYNVRGLDNAIVCKMCDQDGKSKSRHSGNLSFYALGVAALPGEVRGNGGASPNPQTDLESYDFEVLRQQRDRTWRQTYNSY